MAVFCASIGDGLTRNGNFLHPAQSWTKARWVQWTTLPTSYGAIWQVGGAANAETPPWIGAQYDAGVVASVGDIGGGPVGDTGLPMVAGLWMYVATRYDAATTTVSTVLDGTLVPGAFTLDLSGVIPQTGEWLGTDLASDGAIGLTCDRSWQAWLTIDELLLERASATPVRTANLLSNTPLTGPSDLADTVAGHDWAVLGSLTTMDGPLPLGGTSTLGLVVPRVSNSGVPNVCGNPVGYRRQYTTTGVMVCDFLATGVANLCLQAPFGRAVQLGQRVYGLVALSIGSFGSTTDSWSVYSWDLNTAANPASFQVLTSPDGALRLCAHPSGDLVVECARSGVYTLERWTTAGVLVSTSDPLTDPDGAAFLEDFFYSPDGTMVYGAVGVYLVRVAATGGAAMRILNLSTDYVLPSLSRCVALPGGQSGLFNLGKKQMVGPDDAVRPTALRLLDGALQFYGADPTEDLQMIAAEGSTAVWAVSNQLVYQDIGVDGLHVLTQALTRQVVTDPSVTTVQLAGYYTAASSVATAPEDFVAHTLDNGWLTLLNVSPPAPPTPDLHTFTRPIRRVRTTGVLWDADVNHRMRYPGIELIVETGVPLPANGELQFDLQWSDDAGHTWSNLHHVTGGKLGEYRHRVRLLRLGHGRQRSFRIVNSQDATIVLVDVLLNPPPVQGAS